MVSLITIGFIWMGDLGARILQKLMKAGHNVIIWNPMARECMPFREAGAVLVKSARNVFKLSRVTFLCVSDPLIARNIVLGTDGIESSEIKKRGLVYLAGLNSEVSLEFARAMNEMNCRYLEVQILFANHKNTVGQLTLLTTGDEELHKMCYTCFNAISMKWIFLSTEIGQASKMRLVLHQVFGTQLAAMAEGLDFAVNLGIQPEHILEVLNTTDMISTRILRNGDGMTTSRQDWPAQQRIIDLQNDLSVAVDLSDTLDVQVPLTIMANQSLKRVISNGYAQHNLCNIIRTDCMGCQ